MQSGTNTGRIRTEARGTELPERRKNQCSLLHLRFKMPRVAMYLTILPPLSLLLVYPLYLHFSWFPVKRGLTSKDFKVPATGNKHQTQHCETYLNHNSFRWVREQPWNFLLRHHTKARYFQKTWSLFIPISYHANPDFTNDVRVNYARFT